MEDKYKDDVIADGVLSVDFYYDIFEGGYIVPSKILKDDKRIEELEKAILLIEDWKIELYNDGVLIEC